MQESDSEGGANNKNNECTILLLIVKYFGSPLPGIKWEMSHALEQKQEICVNKTGTHVTIHHAALGVDHGCRIQREHSKEEGDATHQPRGCRAIRKSHFSLRNDSMEEKIIKLWKELKEREGGAD